MRLEKIELQGFKSFADRVDLLFDHDVTAVVGPNGSGKSNIADAVRWVLGEQSVKNLRGKSMVDVIFAGTEKRKPLNFCQVSILFDNADGAIPLDYQKVKVTRRYYRSGESEYLINGTPVRLKDIREAFMDTGIGKEGYSIIGQGRVDELLNAKGEDRRRIFEEASGIVKLRYKKEGAQKRLEATEENLKDLAGNLRIQEESLRVKKDQAERAREGLRLTEMLRSQEFALCKSELESLNQKRLGLEEARAIDADKMAQAQGALADLQAALAPKKADLEAMDQKISGLTSDRLKAQRLLSSAEGDYKLVEERKQAAARDHDRLAQAIGDHERKVKGLLISSNQGQADARELQDQISQAKISLRDQTQVRLEKESQAHDLESALQALLVEEAEATERFHRLDAEDQRRQGVRETLMADRAAREKELAALNDQIERAQEALRHAQTKLFTIKDGEAEAGSQLDQALRVQDQASQDLEDAKARILEGQAQVQDLENRFRFLQQAFDQNEGYYRSVQQLLAQAKRRPDLQSRMVGSLADLIEVDGPYQTAIDTALGGALQNIVTPNEDDARYLMDFLKQKGIGRVTFLPISRIQARPQTFLDDPLVLIGASQAVDCDPAIRGIVDHFLNRTYIVQGMDQALAFSRKHPSSYRIITLDGEIINTWGSMVGGVTGKKQSSLLNRRARLDDLSSKLNQAKNDLAVGQSHLGQVSGLFDQAKAQAQAAQTRYDKTLAARLEAEKDLYTHTERSLWLKGEFDQREAQLLDLILEESDGEDLETALQTRQDLTFKRLEAEDRLKQANAESKEALDAQRRADDRLQILERDKVVLDNQMASLQSRIDEAEKDLDRDQEALEGALEMLESQIRASKDLEVQTQDYRMRYNNLESQQEDLEAGRKKVALLIGEEEDKIKALDGQIQLLDRNLYATDLKLAQAVEKAQERESQMCQDYEMDPGDFQKALARVTQAPPKPAVVRELKARLRQVGYFNYASIEDYEEAKAQADHMRVQFEDLEQSKADIEDLIRELEKSMEATFRERFKVIGENFDRIFKILFDGGHAQLSLDQSDVLNANIEIIAQPPGKALQNMSLLSGGERSLTAVALLFAIFETHPAPFCILDEIDAALDEANISRYTRYLRTFPSSIQFIIITHRKTTMEMADLLYGVTMEEEGVSKILTLELEPKEETC